MLNVNSFGPGARSAKTINVEVDLLAEWNACRARTRSRCHRLLAALMGLLLVSLILMPLLVGVFGGARASAAKAAADAEAAALVLQDLEKQETLIAPAIAEQRLLEQADENALLMLDQIVWLANSAGEGVAFSQLRAEASGGTIRLKCQADADGFGTARTFTERIGLGPGVTKTTISSTKRSDVLGAGGLAFELESVCEVAR
jgi:hypothetical protein